MEGYVLADKNLAITACKWISENREINFGGRTVFGVQQIDSREWHRKQE